MMRLGIVLSTNEPETAWNAFRFGVTSLKAGHRVRTFLMNSGVEVEDIRSEKYDIRGQIDSFILTLTDGLRRQRSSAVAMAQRPF